MCVTLVFHGTRRLGHTSSRTWNCLDLTLHADQRVIPSVEVWDAGREELEGRERGGVLCVMQEEGAG